MSEIDPFVQIGCDTEVQLALTPKYIDFNPANAEKAEPNPNSNPEFIFARAKGPAYMALSIVCFDLECFHKNCRADSSTFPLYYKTRLVEEC